MKKILITIAISAASLLANASDGVRINGFSNITAGFTKNQSGMIGYNNDIDFSNESLFALQFSADISDNVTATSQIIARGSEDYNPEFEWAYITYKLTEKTSLTAGRFRLPLFRYSDSLDVSYSYHWTKAPNAVYNVPYNNIDGIRADFQNNIGRFEYSSQLVAGRIKTDYIANNELVILDAKNVILANLSMQYNEWKLRLVASHTDITILLDNIDVAIAPIKEISPELFDNISLKDESSTFLGIGLEYDASEWFIGSEVTRVNVENSYYPEEISYYLTAGLRIDKWTPSITFESKDSSDDIKFIRQAKSLPNSVSGPITALITEVQTMLVQEYLSTGIAIRYDIESDISVKAEVVRMNQRINKDLSDTLFRASVNYTF
jgi:hypothetical protein